MEQRLAIPTGRSEAALPLTAEGLWQAFGFRQVLAGVDVRLGAGEVVALLGPNGAGKSTLLRCLAGLLRPERGTVRWWGRALADGPDPLRRRLGVVGHRSFLFDELTAEENLVYYARLLGLADPEERAREELVAAGLALFGHRPVAELSRGMVQRLSLCRAWLGAPRLILADEPATGLDPAAASRLYGQLDRLRAGGGTALLVAHELSEALAVADRYLILAGGVIADAGAAAPWRGRTEAFSAHYAHIVTAARRSARLRPPAAGRPAPAGPANLQPAAQERPVAAGAALAAVFSREWRLWWRGRERLLATAAFGLLVALVFGLALDPTTVDLRPVFAGVLWTGLLFAGLPAFGRAMAGEWENDALLGYRASGADPAVLFYGKALANLAAFALAEAALVVGFAVLLQVSLAGVQWAVLAGLGLGTLGFVAAGSLLAAVVARALGSAGGGGLALVALPLLAPVILGTVHVVQGALDGLGQFPAPWLWTLGAYALLFWSLPLVLFPLIAEL